MRRACPSASGRDAPQVRGHEPDRQLQGPRHDASRSPGEGQGRGGDHLRLHRQHRRERRRLCRARGHARRRDRAGGQDRARQARPGGDARRAGDLAARQLRPGAGAGQADRRAPAGRARQLDQPVPHRGPEDRRVRGLRRAGRGAGRARDPRRERGQRDRLVEGIRRVRPGPPAPVRVPGRGRRADRARPSVETPRRSRPRSGSATPRAGARRRSRSRNRAARSRRSATRRSWMHSGGSPRPRACSASRLRRPAWPAC